jgi:hypothetical protein
MKLFSLLIVCSFICLTEISAQSDSSASSGSTFKDTRARHFWMGSNYRKEWNTPIKAPTINLATEHGGLTPVKRGGGKQTKSLRLEAKDGTEYILRSIQKYITEKTLPGDIQSQAAADLVSDGVSASYPYASLSVQVLADAAGVPYGKVRLVYVPDDPRLGEFRADFGNMLATFEERIPSGVKKAFDTDEVAEKLEDDNDNAVDQQAMLRARILDMFIMDLDRHEGQWNWGAIDKEKGKLYFPIPKDRDQAFYINDGLLPGFVKGRSLVPQLEGFKPKAKSISRFNFAARNLDRFFLNQLTEADWQQAVDKFVTQMTDAVIEKALAMQPKEIRDISGPTIIATLKERRNYIVSDVMEYYRSIAETVSVTGSDKKELFNVTQSDDGTVLLQVYKIDKDGQQSSKMYERKFEPLQTKEIRIYGMDGEDKFTVSGTTDKIKIRMIGGGGSDVFENTTKGQRGAIIYDRKDGNNTVTGAFKNKMENDSTVNSFERIYYKYPYQSVFGTIGYNPDDGFFIGPTFKFIRHGFRKYPYKSLHQFKASFAFSTKALNINYNNEFISVLGSKTDIITDFEYRGPNGTTNFFGYGANTVYDKTKPGRFRFYRIRYDLGDLALQIRQRFSDKVMLSFGPDFQFYSLDSTDNLNKSRNVFINTLASGLNKNTLYKKQSYFGARVTLLIDTRDNKIVPSTGINWVTNLKYLSGLNDNSYDKVTQVNSDFTFHLNLVKDWLTFANRFGAGITMGENPTATDNKFEFFQAQYLGTEDNLRGYRKQRFAGRSKIYNQAELRLKVANLKTYLFPAAFGIYAFADAGTVKAFKGDATNKTLVGYGAGLWFAPLRKIVITVSYAMSDEDKLPLVGLGWKF